MLVDEQLLNRGMHPISYETKDNVVAYDYETFENIFNFSFHACLCCITILTINSSNIHIFSIASVQKCHEYGVLVVDQACSINYPVIQYCTRFWELFFHDSFILNYKCEGIRFVTNKMC